MKTTYKLIILTILLISVNTMKAQNGVLSESEINKIKESYNTNNSYMKSVTNAVTNNDIKKLALNNANTSKFDGEFKYKVEVSGITNQKSSGRCWMFTGLNVLRPIAAENLKTNEFFFSTNYLYFWDILEKANLFMEAIIASADKTIDSRTVTHLFKNPVNDGGVWNSLANIVTKYGAVPKAIMPETNSSENTGMMIRIINRKLRENGLALRDAKKNNKDTKSLKIALLGDIYKILAINLGEPPTEFKWRFTDKDQNLSEYKKYTPKSFFKEVVPNFDQNNFVMLMNDPTREYYKLYEIELDRNVQEGQNWKYINLPSDEIKKFAIASIKDNKAMYASCDVGKQLNKENGVLDPNNFDYESLFDVKFGMDKKARIQTFESSSSHGMALVAVDVDKNEKPTKWMFENSWGANYGHNGYLIFSDDWFNEYMFRVVIEKQYIDAKTLKILEQKPIMLPPWDPMFSADE